ncbi:potassium channel family protein [Sediminispirochaeta smaragdinae]|jgi:trk system potassium uptake protein TrkA|uniref:TrkA-N domain protein n=1 Tax=Sediminispirochaeta smaragdinae (strain DSM 11293 / JCM 15392 / SEBR 4228) TaxID=573413 RepID=E1R993_SEDSS|nr:TrkA family potassium uptake protein [Sediminispirochaeta smaragdinae]ADK83062.1 TrkA-N domain protein [Sediminispirochaeta smaragdinae DSM 11293]
MARERVFAVIGLGTFGRQVSLELSARGGKVIAVDNQPKQVEAVKDAVTQAVLVDATDEEGLSALSLEEVDVAIVAIGDAVESGILTTAILKRSGVPYIVARAISEIHAEVLRQVGADEVINLEVDEGRRIAQRLIAPHVLDRIPISSSISFAEVYVPRSFVNSTLVRLDLRKRFSINVIAIKRTTLSVDEVGNPLKNEEVIFPDSETVLLEQDVLLVVGKNEDIEAVKEY